MSTAPSRVAILLASFTGERFLRRQLDSLLAQTHRDWSLFVSDDGSTDRTRTIIEAFAAEIGPARVKIFDGPRQGFVANFLSLICRDEIDADYFAYCDQDDEWHADKLARALAALEASPAAGHPARLYGGRSCLVDESGSKLGRSRKMTVALGFSHALVQSYAGANTMVFNAAARDLLRGYGVVAGVASHDWWTYQVVSGAGGQIIYDPVPAVDYRQHNGNLRGHNRGFMARFDRLGELLAGRLRIWNQCHLAALSRHAELLTPANREILALFRTAADGRGMKALAAFRRSGARRLRSVDNVALGLCALLGKL
ncbi:glycosyl transferase family 2 [Betaproteobacteria bacterium]|nr:glycosyl transferase family 2 [Betaproteobacteria bacterium]GHU05224.1 glycosyl transferase family 2 [Betaproteobacteria bacterium]GHU20080.1 glycosyl transferase family 2 [Betaproteobacteria bacterium]